MELMVACPQSNRSCCLQASHTVHTIRFGQPQDEALLVNHQGPRRWRGCHSPVLEFDQGYHMLFHVTRARCVMIQRQCT